MPYDVICPSCRQSTYETIAGKFDPDVLISPDMVRMKDPWRGWGWSGFSHDPGAGHGQMVCLHCDTPLAPAGRLELGEYREPPEPIENTDPNPPTAVTEPDKEPGDNSPPAASVLTCPKCGKEYKHKSSLSRHMRSCNG